MRKSNSFRAQKLKSIIHGKSFNFPVLLHQEGTKEPPADPYRYNRQYPFLLHRDARRIHVLSPDRVKISSGTAEDFAPSTSSQARITCDSPVVNAPSLQVRRGLDFLKVSFWIQWDLRENSFLEILEFMKKKVQDTEQDCIPVFKEHGFDWNLSRTGTSKYNYRLKSGDITMLFNRRKSDGNIPTCRLEIGSLSCWSPGFFSIYQRVKAFISGYGGKIIKERVSEVHMAADFIGIDIKGVDLCDQDKWIAKARDFNPHDKILVYRDTDQESGQEVENDSLDFNPHFTNRKFTGVDLGKGDLMLRVYDKVTELKRSRAVHKQQIFSEIWGLNKFDDESVTRVEYQVRRPKLREFADSEEKRVDTVDDLVKALRSLWHYLTTEWTRHTASAVNRNHNQSKAKISEFWQKVQAVVWSGVFGYVRNHPVKHKDIVMLRKQVRGMLMSVCACLEVEPDDIDHIVGLCKEMIEEDLHDFFEDEKAFTDKMIIKRNEARATLAG